MTKKILATKLGLETLSGYDYFTSRSEKKFDEYSAFIERLGTVYADYFTETFFARCEHLGFDAQTTLERLLPAVQDVDSGGDIVTGSTEDVLAYAVWGLVKLDDLVKSILNSGDQVEQLLLLDSVMDARDECLLDLVARSEEVAARSEEVAARTVRSKLAKDLSYRRHAKSNEARDFVWAEWTKNKSAYNDNKSAFAVDYVKRVFNERDVTIKAKQMTEVWLKAPRLPADRPVCP